jgi:hypothetical protein
MKKAPDYDPDLAHDDYFSDLYGWWGVGPYWAPGYIYPRYPYR